MSESAKHAGGPASNARDLLLAHITRFATYHSQKETMTWSAATLYVVAVSFLLAAGDKPFWHVAPSWKFWPFAALLGITASIAFLFVNKQFQRRLQSHLLVHACSNVAARWLTYEPTLQECEVQDLQQDLADYDFGPDQDYQLMPRAVVDELKEIRRRTTANPKKYRVLDERLTRVLMSAWTVAGIARVLLSRRPIAQGLVPLIPR